MNVEEVEGPLAILIALDTSSNSMYTISTNTPPASIMSFFILQEDRIQHLVRVLILHVPISRLTFTS